MGYRSDVALALTKNGMDKFRIALESQETSDAAKEQIPDYWAGQTGIMLKLMARNVGIGSKSNGIRIGLKILQMWISLRN